MALGRRLEQADEAQEGIGATRWIGQEALVVDDIKTNKLGTVRLERERWRAQSLTGKVIKKGSTVVITSVAGTRLIVVPVDEPIEELPQQSPTSGDSLSESTEGE